MDPFPEKGFIIPDPSGGPELASELVLVFVLGSRAVRDAISSGVKTPGRPAILASCACVNMGLGLEVERVPFEPDPVCSC